MRRSQLHEANTTPPQPPLPTLTPAPVEETWPEWVDKRPIASPSEDLVDTLSYHAAVIPIGVHAVAMATGEATDRTRRAAHGGIGRIGDRLASRLADRHDKHLDKQDEYPTKRGKIGGLMLLGAKVGVQYVANRSTRIAAGEADSTPPRHRRTDGHRGKPNLMPPVRAARAHRNRLVEKRQAAQDARTRNYVDSTTHVRQQFASVEADVNEENTRIAHREEAYRDNKKLNELNDSLVSLLRQQNVRLFDDERFDSRNPRPIAPPSVRYDNELSSLMSPIKVREKDYLPFVENNYDQQAMNALESAQTHDTQPDGSIQLLGRNLWPKLDDVQAEIDSSMITAEELAVQTRENINYIGGVTSLLWKLGFIEFENPKSVPGRGIHMSKPKDEVKAEEKELLSVSWDRMARLNPDRQLDREAGKPVEEAEELEEDKVKPDPDPGNIIVRLPFDPSNDFHNALRGTPLRGAVPPTFIELVMPIEPRTSPKYGNLSLRLA